MPEYYGCGKHTRRFSCSKIKESVAMHPGTFFAEALKVYVNPFVPNAPFLYPLKTSENLMVF